MHTNHRRKNKNGGRHYRSQRSSKRIALEKRRAENFGNCLILCGKRGYSLRFYERVNAPRLERYTIGIESAHYTWHTVAGHLGRALQNVALFLEGLDTRRTHEELISEAKVWDLHPGRVPVE